MSTPVDDIRAAAQTLLDHADETDCEIEGNIYWHSQIADRPHWYANGVENALGGPAGKLAARFPPEVTREIAKWLRREAELHADDEAARTGDGSLVACENFPHAVAVARAIKEATR